MAWRCRRGCASRSWTAVRSLPTQHPHPWGPFLSEVRRLHLDTLGWSGTRSVPAAARSSRSRANHDPSAEESLCACAHGAGGTCVPPAWMSQRSLDFCAGYVQALGSASSENNGGFTCLLCANSALRLLSTQEGIPLRAINRKGSGGRGSRLPTATPGCPPHF